MNKLDLATLDRHIFLAELAGIEYFPNRDEMYYRLGFRCRPVEASDDQCTVLQRRDPQQYDPRLRLGTIISIRGTESEGDQMLADWGANARVMRWYDKRVGWCQKGHLRGAQALWKALGGTEYTLPLTITGHSRGGGLAIILACRLVHEFPQIRDQLEVVTFGAPRVTMQGARDRLNGVWVTQYANPGDVVTKVMPRTWLLYRYCHVARVYTDRERSGTLDAHKISNYRYALMTMRDMLYHDALERDEHEIGMLG